MLDHDVVIVGAGSAGISAARVLQDAGLSVMVLEASHHLGGRIRAVPERELALCPMSSHAMWMQRHAPSSGGEDDGGGDNDDDDNDSGELLGEGAYVFESGAEFVHGERTALFVAYDGELGGGTDNHQLRAGFRFTW